MMSYRNIHVSDLEKALSAKELTAEQLLFDRTCQLWYTYDCEMEKL